MTKFLMATALLLCAGNVAMAQHLRVRVEYVSVETIAGAAKPQRLPAVEGLSREEKLAARLGALRSADKLAELIDVVKKGRVIKQDVLVGVLRPEEPFELKKTQEEREFSATGKVTKQRSAWSADLKFAWHDDAAQRPQGLQMKTGIELGRDELLGDLIHEYRQDERDVRVHTLVFLRVEEAK